VAGSQLSWDDYVDELDRDLRRHGMAEDAVEEAVADFRSQVERGERTARSRREPADEGTWIRHARRPLIWRALTRFPSRAGTLVVVITIGLAWEHSDWWPLAGVIGVFLLEVHGIMPVFRRWADRLFDGRTGAPVSAEAGVRLVRGGIGYVLLLAFVAGQIVA
jgi:hypothetical protein